MIKVINLVRISVLSIAILSATSMWAQNIEFKSANFKDDKDGLKTAMDEIKLGDEFLELGNQAVVSVNDVKDHFQRALFHYEKAQKFNPNNDELNYKI